MVDGKPQAEDTQRAVQEISGEVEHTVRLEDLGRLIRDKRRSEHLTLEQAAYRSGVSAATLSRWERHWAGGNPGSSGAPLSPDTRTLSALRRWLGVSLESILHVEPPRAVEAVAHHEGETTPDIVTAHLRADRNLDSKTAEAFGRLFRSAYEQFSLLSNSKEEARNSSRDESIAPTSVNSIPDVGEVK